jgi:hypothetical protein
VAPSAQPTFNWYLQKDSKGKWATVGTVCVHYIVNGVVMLLRSCDGDDRLGFFFPRDTSASFHLDMMAIGIVSMAGPFDRTSRLTASPWPPKLTSDARGAPLMHTALQFDMSWSWPSDGQRFTHLVYSFTEAVFPRLPAIAKSTTSMDILVMPSLRIM